MFRNFGHQNSSIIDGGLPRWADEDLPLETTEPTQPPPTRYPAPKLNEEAIKSTLHALLRISFLSHLVLQVTIRSYPIRSTIPLTTQNPNLFLMRDLEAGASEGSNASLK